MDERQHTPEESDYARGYRMSIVELESLRGELASSQATITALVEALRAVVFRTENGTALFHKLTEENAEAALAALALGLFTRPARSRPAGQGEP